jgi:capsular exopolysaccharide synthesis family protein
MAKIPGNQQPQGNMLNSIKKYYTDTPGSAEIERLGAKLDALRNGKKKQTILITSSVMGEGKSTVASLLARSIAIHRKETLLIDFDLRRPRLHEIFEVNGKNGLIDIMQSDLPFNSALKTTSIPHLKLISSGSLDVAPSEILNNELIKSFFDSIGNDFDNVVVDSPPVIHVSDPLLLSKFVNEVILVVKAGSTPKYVIKRSISMFDDVKVKISGIILNNMQNTLPHYYDYKSYGYQYYGYRGEREESKIDKWKHDILKWIPKK